jgi:hypothetical protein
MAAQGYAMRGLQGWARRGCGLVALAGALMLAGCATSAPQPSARRLAASLPDRAREVIAHCPELACTTAEVPGCEFSENIEDGGVAMRQSIRCDRAGTETACVERRSPVGGENTLLENQRLRFRCSGDPLQCEVTGGNATWPAGSSIARGALPGGLSCHAPRRAGPTPASHSVPGPDTV